MTGEIKLNLKVHHIDEGFCRIVYVGKYNGQAFYYALQLEQASFCELYNVNPSDYGEYEPSQRTKFKPNVKVRIEVPRGNSHLCIAAKRWIEESGHEPI